MLSALNLKLCERTPINAVGLKEYLPIVFGGRYLCCVKSRGGRNLSETMGHEDVVRLQPTAFAAGPHTTIKNVNDVLTRQWEAV